MNFAKEYFNHFLLAAMAVLSAGVAVWCDIHGHNDASKWLFGQAGGFASALLLLMKTTTTEAPKVPNAQS